MAASSWPRRLAGLYVGLVAASGALYWLTASIPGNWPVVLVLPWSVLALFIGFLFAAPVGGIVAAVLFLGGVAVNTWGIYALSRRLTRRYQARRSRQ